MEAVFLTVLNMSLTASWLVLAVMLLRLALKKAPKAIAVCLWALVAVRLVCPFSLESIFSLIPSAEPVPNTILYDKTPTVHSGVPLVNDTVNHILSESFTPQAGDSVNPLQIVAFVASIVWIVGMVAMLLYTVISYVRIRRSVREAVPYQDNVWLCDRIDTPFILGVVRPRVYLPSAIREADIPYVIAHENAHLKRHDHWWKPLGFLLLTVYWFNPLLWVAYVLLCKDIELACDEKVIKELGADGKKPYSEALLNCSLPRKRIAACPLAFGEVGIKGRIKSVLHYKKPAFWVIVAAVVLSVAVAVCFLTDPKSDNPADVAAQKDTQVVRKIELVYYNETYSYEMPIEYMPPYKITDDMQLLGQVIDNQFWPIGTFEEVALDKTTFDSRLSNAVWLTDDTMESLKNNNRRFWQLCDEPSYDLYVLLEQTDGTFYLGCGTLGLHLDTSNSDHSCIQYLFRVEFHKEHPPVNQTSTSDYTGVALHMPDRISLVDEGYGDYAVEPFSEDTLAFYVNGSDFPYCVRLSEERIKELNALYESITEFKDYGGDFSSDETVVLERDGQTYRFRSGCATQRALNLYIDKIFAREASDEEWREIDNTEYYSEWQESPPSSAEYTGVPLNMPDSVAWSGGYAGLEEVFTKYNDNTLKIITNSQFSCSKLVTLSEERIKELNALYEAVTDFSQSSIFGDGGELLVIIHREGQVHILGDACAKQGELNRYLRLLSSCDSKEGTWVGYPAKDAERELEEYFSHYNEWVAESPTTTTAPTTAYTGPSLHMPSIDSWNDSWYTENFGTFGLLVYQEGPNVIRFYSENYGEKLVELTPDEVAAHNALYESVTDFASSPEPQDGEVQVSLSDGDRYYWFCPSRTTQPQAAQYIQLLESYYLGE